MKSIIQRIAVFALALCLSACANVGAPPAERDYLPGGVQYYSFGTSQSKENFANVERAQSNYVMYTKEKWWSSIRPGVAPSSINMLQTYYPLHVRWQLKDGRQFIAHIDTRAVMREYFKTHNIKMQWQREGRPQAQSGDYDPSLVHEVKDDKVILKWLLRLNKTPVDQRYQSNGAANSWQVDREEHIVTAIQGQPTSGIDFEKWVEILK